MGDMIETMARALYERRNPPGMGFVAWEKLGKKYGDRQAIYRADVQAVLASLHAAGMVIVPREPTEAMLWAHELPHIGPDDIRELWQAMLAATKEPS